MTSTSRTVWFLRTDKDDFSNAEDISENHQFIYSAHGICAKDHDHHIHLAAAKIFPSLILDETELRALIRVEKKRLVEFGMLDVSQKGKTRCDLFISYWIAVMKHGDIVFVRNKQNTVYACKITGYISEAFFNKFGYFQRPVEILESIKHSDNFRINQLAKIWPRTFGRKTLERNRSIDVEQDVNKYFPN